MSIPLDRLYHFIENIAEEIHGSALLIYRFYPHGSKKLEDLKLAKPCSWKDTNLMPVIHCNDQEPLDFDYYDNYASSHSDTWSNILRSTSFEYCNLNLRRTLMYDKMLLIHSEQRSLNLKKYQQTNWLTIYYWSHALLSLDWFRYANHVNIVKKPIKKFLIYNRAWSGTREYRLKFADLLISYGLVDDCQTSISFWDQDIHYKNYKYKDTRLRPCHDLENYFKINNTPSTSSADFNINDYANTNVEIVLETLFDDDRLHLTEKSLRPIACGQPFILAATYGSLEYLRSYGFQTFDSVIDETYDTIEDPVERLTAIVKVMQDISNWSIDQTHEKISKLQKIADYNKQHFFSSKFYNQIVTELKTNVANALEEYTTTKSCKQFINFWDHLLPHSSVTEFLKINDNEVYPTKTQLDIVYSEAKKYNK